MVVLIKAELQILELVSEGTHSYSDINRRLTEGDELRPSTVSGLVTGLLKCGYLAYNKEGKLHVSQAGLEAISATAFLNLVPSSSQISPVSSPKSMATILQQNEVIVL